MQFVDKVAVTTTSFLGPIGAICLAGWKPINVDGVIHCFLATSEELERRHAVNVTSYIILTCSNVNFFMLINAHTGGNISAFKTVFNPNQNISSIFYTARPPEQVILLAYFYFTTSEMQAIGQYLWR